METNARRTQPEWLDSGVYYLCLHHLLELMVTQDFDGGPIGRTVTQALMNATGPKTEINWYTVPASEFSGGERELPDKVVNERAWVAVASEYTLRCYSRGRC